MCSISCGTNTAFIKPKPDAPVRNNAEKDMSQEAISCLPPTSGHPSTASPKFISVPIENIFLSTGKDNSDSQMAFQEDMRTSVDKMTWITLFLFGGFKM